MKWQISSHTEIPSTQDLVKADAYIREEGFCVQALSQSAGRGRQGNQWISAHGNLYLSFLLKPDIQVDVAGQLSFVVACALGRTFQSYGVTPHYKWPNDILVMDKKISGILLETSVTGSMIDWVVVGVGVNVANHPEGAISLNILTGKILVLNDVRDRFLSEMAEIYDFWKRNGFSAVRDEWMAEAYGLGQTLKARLPKTTMTGIFQGLDDTGALQLLTDDGLKTIRAAEVYFGEN